MEQQVNDIRSEPMPLKAILKKFNTRYWQVVRRCASNGVFVREAELSRILNGLEEPSERLREQLVLIEVQLRELDGTQDNKT